MKSDVKCYRCGTKIDVNYKNIGIITKCPHCNAKMTLDKKSYRTLRIVRYLVVLLACLFIVFGLSKLNSKEYALTFICLSIALAFGLVADRLCLWLEYKIFGLKYVEYISSKREK